MLIGLFSSSCDFDEVESTESAIVCTNFGFGHKLNQGIGEGEVNRMAEVENNYQMYAVPRIEMRWVSLPKDDECASTRIQTL